MSLQTRLAALIAAIGADIKSLAAGKADASKGVTNGDAHDHSGGDGGQIAYSSLSGLPTLGTAAPLNVAASGDAAAGEVVKGDDTRLSDSREWSAATVDQAEAEAGTATTRRAWTAQRVKQAVASWCGTGLKTINGESLIGPGNISVSGGGVVGTLSKADGSTPCLIKTGGGTLAVKAGTAVYLSGGVVSFAAQTAITMPTLTAGEDYSVWVLPGGTAQAVADPFSSPATAPAPGALKIGGFHCSLTAPGTTVAGGKFAASGNGMIWTQHDVYLIAGINAWSIWDLHYRPACPNPRGMARTIGGAWVDIYFCSTDVDINGSSRYNTNVASGTVLPKKPLAFGGDGAETYPGMTWWVASELAHAVGKRLPWEHEFVDAAFGVTEASAIGGVSATIPATGRAAGFTSRIGIEQATGHIWTWGMDSGQAGETYSWQAITGSRGSTYTTPHRRVLLGGARNNGWYAGSRCSNWGLAPSNSDWGVGLRAACDHYQGG